MNGNHKFINVHSKRIGIYEYFANRKPEPKYECKAEKIDENGNSSFLSCPMFFPDDLYEVKNLFYCTEFYCKSYGRGAVNFHIEKISDETRAKYLKAQKIYFKRNEHFITEKNYPELTQDELYLYNNLSYFYYDELISCPACSTVNSLYDYVDKHSLDEKVINKIKCEYDDWRPFYRERIIWNSIICPHCGCEFSKNDIFEHNAESEHSLRTKSALLSYKEDKIVLYGNVLTFIINGKAKKLITKEIHPAIVFNVKSGQTHILPTLYANKKKVTKDLHLINSTYTYRFIPKEVVSMLSSVEIRTELCKAILNRHGHGDRFYEWANIVGENDSHKIETSFINMITLFNRFPMLDIDQIKTLVTTCSYDDFHMTSSIFHNIKTTTKKQEFISLLDFGKNKPTKQTKRLISLDLTNAYLLKTFYRLGFKNQDLFPKFASEAKLDEICSISGIKVRGNRYVKFIKKLIKVRGETSTLNILCSVDMSKVGLYQVTYNYEMIVSAFTTRLPDYLFKGRISEIAFRLNNLVKLFETHQQEIPAEFYHGYDIYINGIDFREARNSLEIANAYSQLHLGQAPAAIEKAIKNEISVVLGYDHGKIVMVININNTADKPTLCLAKTYANNKAQGQYAIALSSLIKKLGLKIDDCHDCIDQLNIRFDKPSYSPSSYSSDIVNIDSGKMLDTIDIIKKPQKPKTRSEVFPF